VGVTFGLLIYAAKVVPSRLISYSEEVVAVTSKSREQREGAKTIEGGQQEEKSISKVTPEHKKEWRPKKVISASNKTRLEATADVSPSPLEKYVCCFATTLR
jgi:hypothetical protein